MEILSKSQVDNVNGPPSVLRTPQFIPQQALEKLNISQQVSTIVIAFKIVLQR